MSSSSASPISYPYPCSSLPTGQPLVYMDWPTSAGTHSAVIFPIWGTDSTSPVTEGFENKNYTSSTGSRYSVVQDCAALCQLYPTAQHDTSEAHTMCHIPHLGFADEVQLLQEEMRRVAAYLLWHATCQWWDAQADRRTGLALAEVEGIRGYAKRQAAVRRDLHDTFISKWGASAVNGIF
ncbi:hypothetical protein BDR03DRAFT_983926 [Suillus americanus]|nr:hypothetical protein BDR03DRAFT_983926 [Suillus americanus]